MDWEDITDALGLNREQIQVRAFHISDESSPEARELALIQPSRQTLHDLGLRVDPDVPITIVAASAGHAGTDSSDGGVERHDLYFAISHGPEGSKGPIIVMNCHKHH